ASNRFQCMTPKLMFSYDRAAFEEMRFRPRQRALGTTALLNCRSSHVSLAQRRQFFGSDLLFPKLPQQTGGNRLTFSRSFFVRDVFANRVLVSAQLVWM